VEALEIKQIEQQRRPKPQINGIVIWSIGGAGIAIAGLLFWLGWTPWGSKPTDGAQATIATATATLLVAWFGISATWYAKNETEAAKAAVNIAIEAERNSATPIIKLSYTLTIELLTGPTRYILYKNIGQGPALNTHIRIAELNIPTYTNTALGAGEEGNVQFAPPEPILNEYHVTMEYHDIYDRRLASTMTLTREGDSFTPNAFQYHQAGKAPPPFAS